MNIVMGIPFLYPAIGYGGAARSAYELAETLQQFGHEVTVLTTDVWDAHSRYSENGFRQNFEVIRVPNISNLVAYNLQFYTPLGILKHAQRLLVNADILHLHTFRNILNDLLARSAVKQGIPFVLTGHGTIPRIERFIRIKQVYDLLLGKWQLRNASGYIAVSAAERQSMRRFGLPDEKIRIIPNGISEIKEPESRSFRQKYGLKPDEKIVLFLGKITPRKGLQHLVRAYARIRDSARLVIAGNDMGYGSHVRRLIFEFRLDDRVCWTGLLNDSEKREALEEANVTVYPSRNEVFGLVALESICAGTPVIVCDDDGCGEVVRQVGGGDLVPWGDTSALQNAIQRRLGEGKNEVELQMAQEKIRSLFNWHLVGKKVEKFYENCIRKAK